MVCNDNEVFNGTADLYLLLAALTLRPGQDTELQEICPFLNPTPPALSCILETS